LVERLRAIRAEFGTTLLVVEQNAQVALALADHGYVMENGRVVLDGSLRGCANTRTSASSTSVPANRRGAAIARCSSTGAAAGGMAELALSGVSLAFGGPFCRCSGRVVRRTCR